MSDEDTIEVVKYVCSPALDAANVRTIAERWRQIEGFERIVFIGPPHERTLSDRFLEALPGNRLAFVEHFARHTPDALIFALTPPEKDAPRQRWRADDTEGIGVIPGDPYQIAYGCAAVAVEPYAGTRSLIAVQYARSFAVDIAPVVRQFLKLVEQRGYTVRQGSPGRSGGRPSQSDDDWAWHEIHTSGRPANEVREEWRHRNEVSGRFLKDEQRSWKNAIRCDRMEKRRRKQPE